MSARRVQSLIALVALTLWGGPAQAQDANGDGVDDVAEINLVTDGDMEADAAWTRYGSSACLKGADGALQGALGLRCGPGGAGARTDGVPIQADGLYRVRWRHRLTSGVIYVFIGTTTDGIFTALPNGSMTIAVADDTSGWGERMVRAPEDVGDGLSLVFLATGQADLDAVSVVSQAETNSVLAGGDFERAGLPGWQPYGNTRCAAADDAGNTVLRCPAYGTLEQTGMPVAAETIYTLSYRVRVNTSVVQTYLGTGTGAAFSMLPGGFVRHAADGQWQTYERRFAFNTTPDTQVRFIIYAFGDADVDDVTFTPTVDLQELAVDGGFEGGRTLAWTAPRLVTPCQPSADAALAGSMGLRCGQGAQSRQTAGVVGGEAYVISAAYRSATAVPTSPLGTLPPSPDWSSQAAIVDVDGDQTSLVLSFEGAPTVDVDSVQLVRLPDALQDGEFRTGAGWRRYSRTACALETGVGYGSNESLRCAPGGMTQRGFTLTPGQNYRLRFAWRNNADSFLWAFVGVRSGITFTSIPGTTRRFNEDTAGEWRTEEVFFTATDPGTGYFDITFLADDAQIDAVSIVPVL